MNKKKIFGIIAFTVIIVLSFTACSGGGGKNFNNVEKVEDWLAKQKGGGSPDDPISFSVKTNLQNMASAESNWQKLLTSIDTAGLYVALDLSGCTMPTTEFDADGGITKGKKFIVSLVLPDSTENIKGYFIGQYYNLRTAKSKNLGFFFGDTNSAGGFVFYDKGEYSDGWRYLEAAPKETEFRAEWGAYGQDVKGTETGIGTGRKNTGIIVEYLNQQGEKGRAAQLCAELNYNGYSDWFLPSIDELELIYKNLHVNGEGEFVINYYWSSSQYNSNNSWDLRFGSGDSRYFKYSGKDCSNNFFLSGVRAVRYF